MRTGFLRGQSFSFGFHRWARQALGPPGLLLGWTPVIQARSDAGRAGLDEFIAQSNVG
jgi:hypothetical protein